MMNRRQLIDCIPGFAIAGTAAFVSGRLSREDAAAARCEADQTRTVTAQDPHPEWLHAFRASKDAYTASLTETYDETPATHAAWDERVRLSRLMVETPATTAAGAAALVAWVLEDSEEDLQECGHIDALHMAMRALGVEPQPIAGRADRSGT